MRKTLIFVVVALVLLYLFVPWFITEVVVPLLPADW